LLIGAAQHGKDGTFRFVQQGDMASSYWVEGGSAYALIGRLARDDLMGLTKTVYATLKKPSGPVPSAPASSPLTVPAAAPPPADVPDAPTNGLQPINAVRPKAS